MPIQPVEINLDLNPRSRFDIIDVAEKISNGYGDLLADYRMTTCCSFHTTAGYLEQRLCAKLGYNRKRFDHFISNFQVLFPPHAGYHHDRIELRKDLSDSEKDREPPNADSHLIFIGAGLRNCVTYAHKPKSPIYFIDLDGVYRHCHRNRRTTVLAYNKRQIVYHGRFLIPVTGEHSISSLNLKDPRCGLFSHLNDLLSTYGINRGLIDIRLAQNECHAALTVNEYETLLMRNDLPEAMSNPLRYVLRRGKKLLQNPTSIPGKTRSYVIYDLIHLYNDLMKNTQFFHSVANKALSYLSTSVFHVFRLKRHISLLVSSDVDTGIRSIVQGNYQSPILLQHQRPDKDVRCLDITLTRFE